MENIKKENKANNNNYTPYRKNYSKAKSLLVKKYHKEFKEILKSLNGKPKNWFWLNQVYYISNRFGLG